MLVDDHAVVRSGLRLLLDAEHDMEVVGEAGNAKDAIFRARALKPDVILLDVVMPGESGIEVLPKLLKESPETKVLVLSMQDDPQLRARGLRRRCERLRAEGSGRRGGRVGCARDRRRRPLRPSHARRAHGGGRGAGASCSRSRPLSEREREVLRLLALGHTNQEIAQELFISVRTAESHRAHIMQKLRLATRAELVRYALSHGLLAEDAS